jgi:hypothetical protein
LGKEGDVTERGEAEAPRAKGRGLDALALRELRTARQLFTEGDSSAAEANFRVASARVLATLDLAAAIREADGIKD